MSVLSYRNLRKITIFVLVVTALSFGTTEIHKRFVVPRQQQATAPTTIPTEPVPEASVPSPTRGENRIALVLGTVSAIGNQSFILTTINSELQITFSSQTTFYTTSQPGCDIEINPNCEGPIVPSTKEEVLQEGATATVACEQSGPGSFVAERVNLVTSR